MKRNLFLLITAITPVLVDAPPFYESYANYSGDVRDQIAVSATEVMYANTKLNNAGSATSPYIFIGDVCTKTQFAFTWNDFDVENTGNIPACVFGFVIDKTGIPWAYGQFIKESTVERVLFAEANPITRIATPLGNFRYTGSNAANQKITNASQIHPDTVRVWNNSHPTTPVQINGTDMGWVADLNIVTNTVTPRPDLTPTKVGGTPRIHIVRRMSNGNIFTGGHFDAIGGRTASKAFVENLSTGVITDLGIDSKNGPYVSWVQEDVPSGTMLLGYTDAAPDPGRSSGLLKLNIATNAASPAGAGFKIGTQKFQISNGVAYVVGFPLTTQGSYFASYNINSDTWTDLDPGPNTKLYKNKTVGSNVISTIAIVTGCPSAVTTVSLGGNFNQSLPSTSPLYSDVATNLATYKVTSQALAQGMDLRITSKKPVKLEWSEVSLPAELQKSSDGVIFRTIHSVAVKDGSYIDQSPNNGKTFYQIKSGGKISNIVSMTTSGTIVKNLGHSYEIQFSTEMKVNVYGSDSRLLEVKQGQTITIQKRNQKILIVEVIGGETFKLQ